MFEKILIANRGEIACRVMRTAQQLGVRCVAVYSDADRDALHVKMADEACYLGPAPASESYLCADKIIAAAQSTGTQAIHPGYGFLSENPEFVEACEQAGIVFIGPSAHAIRAMGLKDAAKQLMVEANVAVVPGYHGDEQSPEFLAEQARQIGYPILIKARAGGGGKGMRRVDDEADFLAALESAQREGEAAFADGHVLIEKYITTPRHIEVQVFGDQHGHVLHLFERDCSLQRRHQKVIEEAPAPGMTEVMRQAMGEAAVRAAQAVGYSGAGTVEFIVDASAGLQADRFYFMEMNTRLQVEHPVTEMVTGLDLVEWQLRVAAGERLPFEQDDLRLVGHAFEARIYAEDVAKGFVPATGTLKHLYLPEHLARIDTGVQQGDTITPFYDPMIAKLTVHAETREQALNQLIHALEQSRVAGCVTNIAFLARLAGHNGFRKGEVDTGLIDRELDGLLADSVEDDTALLLAGLAFSGVFTLRLRSGNDVSSALAGWGHWGASPVYCDVFEGEVLHELVLNPFEILEVTEEQGCLHVRFARDKRVLTAHLLLEAGEVTVFYAGRARQYRQPDYLETDNTHSASADQLLAPMPGQIKILAVQAGDVVKQGQRLLVMEAMKMELGLDAPRDGVVAEILVEAGDQVTDGTLLLALEPEE